MTSLIKRICKKCSGDYYVESIYSNRKLCCAECRFKSILPDEFDKEKCYNWPKSLNIQTGYGQFNISQSPPSKIVSTHRMSYITFNGKLEDEELVRHTCDNRSCVNPHHLVKGTQAENIYDMWERGRQQDYSKCLRKLNETQVLEIKNSKLSRIELSKKLNISVQSIADILNGRYWKHV